MFELQHFLGESQARLVGRKRAAADPAILQRQAQIGGCDDALPGERGEIRRIGGGILQQSTKQPGQGSSGSTDRQVGTIDQDVAKRGVKCGMNGREFAKAISARELSEPRDFVRAPAFDVCRDTPPIGRPAGNAANLSEISELPERV